MNKFAIEKKARECLRTLWESKHIYWPENDISHFDVLDPKVAIKHYGLKYEVHPIIADEFRHRGMKYRVAGLIDTQRNVIAVSDVYSCSTSTILSAPATIMMAG